MGTELEKETPNVVTELTFRQLVASGYLAEVVCQAEAFRKASVWYGEWIVRVVNTDRTFEKLLVTTPRRVGEIDEIKVRVFKTINGLTSFMHEVGFAHVDTPLFSGNRTLHSIAKNSSEESGASGSGLPTGGADA